MPNEDYRTVRHLLPASASPAFVLRFWKEGLDVSEPVIGWIVCVITDRDNGEVSYEVRPITPSCVYASDDCLEEGGVYCVNFQDASGMWQWEFPGDCTCASLEAATAHGIKRVITREQAIKERAEKRAAQMARQ